MFSGEVAAIEKEAATSRHPGTATVTLRVSESWKGPEGAMLEVKSSVGGSACGYPFKEGQEYLVYASGGRDLEVSLCSETKPLSKADADLALLGNGKKPKDGGDALNDTSGVVGPRGGRDGGAGDGGVVVGDGAAPAAQLGRVPNFIEQPSL